MDLASIAARLRRPRRSDLLLAATIGVVAQLETWLTNTASSKPLYATAALAMTAPLVWRRVAPIAVLAVVFMPLLVMALAGRSMESSYLMLVLLAAFSAVGAYSERRRAVIGLALGLGLLAIVMVAENVVDSEGVPAPVVGDLVFLGAIVSVVWALAVALRDRSQRAGELEDRAARLEREQEQQARAAVAEERARIARELHDVVAHSISVIAVQTGSIRHRLRNVRPDEAQELVSIEQTARQALAEMRRMLGLLRSDDDGLSLAPQPGMNQLDQLVEKVRAAGLNVELELEGEHKALPPGVDLAAYRIVQEALTNVIKHAGPARAHIAVRFGERELELEVSDDGHGPAAEPDGGHGLVGMRERVALYGGSLDARPGADGGFVVNARLPVAGA